MSGKIFDVTLKVRVVAEESQAAEELAIHQVADWVNKGYVPLGTTLDSSIKVQECDSDLEANELDANGIPLQLRDYTAKELTGVLVGTLGHKVWVCIDGVAVLRVKTPEVHLVDQREESSVQSS